MVEKLTELGQVKLTQLQPSGLIINTPDGEFYDVSRRVVVEQLIITPQGIEATTPDGEHVLDIHHINHPDKAYDDDDLVCIGHYLPDNPDMIAQNVGTFERVVERRTL